MKGDDHLAFSPCGVASVCALAGTGASGETAMVFDANRADFSVIVPVTPATNLYVSNAEQVVKIKVGEEGTEAA